MVSPIILKETSDYILINKPAGLVVHSDGRTNEVTLCDFLLQKFPEIENIGEPMCLPDGTVIKRPGIVHRLDRDTSGVILIARNQSTYHFFKKQFQDRAVEKTYHTFVYGNIKEDDFIVDEPIGRSKKDFRQWIVKKFIQPKKNKLFETKENLSQKIREISRGKNREAVTKFRVLHRASDKSITMVEACPKTGRTHQIRVHLKHIYHPIIADDLYAPNRPKLLGFDRLALHAHSIKFKTPSGDEVFCEASYPDDFKNAIDEFNKLAL